MPRTPKVTARYPSNGHSTWAHTQVPLMRCRSLGLVPEGNNGTIDFAWHHMIPFNDLRDFWNSTFVIGNAALMDATLDLFNCEARSEGWTALKTKIRDFKAAIMTDETAPSGTYGLWLERLGTAQNNLLSVDQQLSADQELMLAEVVSWSPWNIVEGPLPNHRTDDPGDEAFDDFRNLNRYHNAGHMNRVYDLYGIMRGMRTWMQARQERFPTLTEINEKRAELLESVTGFTRFLKTVPLVKFSEHHWQYVLNPRTQNPETLTLVGLNWYRWKRVCA
jgi:hypothetical protein